MSADRKTSEAAEPPVYYYVCDECGNLADVTATRHGEECWVCEHDGEDEHGDSTLSEFLDKDEALAYADARLNLHYAARQARIDQALARLDEMKGKP